jgi:uncharacterized membrane protein
MAGFTLPYQIAHATAFTYTDGVFDLIPGVHGAADSANGINDAGKVVGVINLGGTHYAGFVAGGGSFQMLSFPGSISTWAAGINDSGDIVGDYFEPDGGLREFLYSGGSYRNIIPFRAVATANGINDRGQIVGSLDQSGFLYDGGALTTLMAPGALSTSPEGVNNAGVIVGGYLPPGATMSHGFVYSGGAFTTLDFPGSIGTSIAGINNLGQMVGNYSAYDAQNRIQTSGFLYSGGVFTAIDVPGGGGTYLNGINDSGVIVGFTFGNVPEDVPEPAPFALCGFGVILLATKYRSAWRAQVQTPLSTHHFISRAPLGSVPVDGRLRSTRGSRWRW